MRIKNNEIKGRGRSLNVSNRFIDTGSESMMSNMPVALKSNGKFGTIDIMKLGNKAHLKSHDIETPVRYRTNNQAHNDSIYQSDVNNSFHSGMGLTPQNGSKRRE